MMRVHIGDFDKYCNEDKNIIYIDMLTIILKREHKIKLRHNKLYRLKKIQFDFPELFDISLEPNKETVE